MCLSNDSPKIAGSEKPIKWLLAVLGVIVAVIFSLCTTLLFFTFKALDAPTIEIPSVIQISKDWGTTPFTQINLRTEFCSKSNEERVFGVLWEGTRTACDGPEESTTDVSAAR